MPHVNWWWMKHPIDRWTTPEAALVAYRVGGNASAVRALFDLTAPTLFRVALASAPDAPSAEDLIQETYIAFLGRLEAFEPGQPVMPWLLGILRNRIKRARRSAMRRPDPKRLVMREGAANDHAHEDASQAREAIEALEEPYRSVALLHLVYGLEPAEIAHVRGQPPGTVRSQLHRARERLANRLRTSPALLLLGDPVRSLAAVREAVVSSAVPASAAGVVTLGGTLMAKKIMLPVAVVALLAFGAVVMEFTGDDTSIDETTPGLVAADSRVEAPGLKGTTPVRVAQHVAIPPDGPYAAARVLNAQGAAIAGARLAVIPSDTAVGQDPHGPSILSALTDANGRVFVPLTDDAPSFFLYTEAPGYAPVMGHVVRNGDDVVVSLTRATALTGIVRNRDGKAVPGARVALMAMIGAASRTWNTRADSTGTYRLEGLPNAAATSPAGTMLGCWIRAVADGYAPSTTRLDLTAAAGEAQTKDVYVLRGVSIRGKVTLVNSKVPVANAQVVLTPSGRTQWRMLVFGHEIGVPFETAPLARVRADADGRFAIEHAPPPQLGQGPGGTPAVYAWGANTCLGMASLTGAEDEGEVEVTVEVHPAAIVTGRLVNAAGTGVADTRVWAKTTGLRAASGLRTEQPPSPWGRTDGTGSFRLTGVPARLGEKTPAVLTSGGRVHFGASFQKGIERDIRVEGGVTLDLGTVVYEGLALSKDQEARTSRIRLVDASGKGVWGAAVGHSYTNLILRTDREGRTGITWAGSGTGPVSMLVRAAGFATRLVQVPIGEAEQIVELNRETAMIRGAVVDPSGEPIRGAFIEVAPESVAAADAFPADKNFWQMSRFVLGVGTTDPAGHFAVADLSPGIYRLRAHAPVDGMTGLSMHSVIVSGVATEEEGVEIRLPLAPASDGVRVDLRITDASSGRPVLGATASLRAGGRTLYGPGDGPGRRYFIRVPVGEAALTVSAPGYVSDRRTLAVGTSASEPIELALVLGAGLRGHAKVPGSKAERSQYWIRLLATTGERRTDPAYLVHITEDGSFTTRGLQAGRYYVVAHQRSHKPEANRSLVPRNPSIDIPPRGTTERTFVFEAAGTLRVQPSDLRLPPRPRGIQTATPEQARFGQGSWLLLKDDAGNDVMRHAGVALGHAGALGNLALRPGRYTLHVKYHGEDLRELPVTIEAGKEETLSP